MLALNLARIRTAETRFEQVYSPQAFTADPRGEFTVAAPVDLQFDIHKDKAQFRLVGSVRTTLELRCSRCVEAFTSPVDASFDLRYQPHATTAAEAEREINADDLTTAFYENDEIDLDQLMTEQFHLSLPMKPLCRDDCRGLCPTCGTNLNRETCSCTREWSDPRLAVLKTLKTKG